MHLHREPAGAGPWSDVAAERPQRGLGSFVKLAGTFLRQQQRLLIGSGRSSTTCR